MIPKRFSNLNDFIVSRLPIFNGYPKCARWRIYSGWQGTNSGNSFFKLLDCIPIALVNFFVIGDLKFSNFSFHIIQCILPTFGSSTYDDDAGGF